MQQPFNNYTLLFKIFNCSNQINQLSQCTWLGTLCSMVCFPTHSKTKILFLGGGSFWPGLWVMFLCWHLSQSDTNKIWSLDAVTPWLFFGGVSKDCTLSPTKTIRVLGALTLLLFFLLGVSNYWASSKPNKIWALGAVILELFSLGVSKYWASLSTKIFQINIYF